MTGLMEIMDAIRCLQQLAGSTGATPDSLAELEDLHVGPAEVLLKRLAVAGFVEMGDAGRYRLARAPERIRIADVSSALGGSARGVDSRLTLAHLLDWESQVFAADSVAVAA